MSSLSTILRAIETHKPLSGQAASSEDGFRELEQLFRVDDDGHLSVLSLKAQAAGASDHQIEALSQIARAGNTALRAAGARTASAVSALLSGDSGAAAGVRHGSTSVRVKVKAWGLYIAMTHEFLAQLTTVAAVVDALLERVGVADWVRAIVAAVLAAFSATLQALDEGDGAWIKLTWLGIPIGMGAL